MKKSFLILVFFLAITSAQYRIKLSVNSTVEDKVSTKHRSFNLGKYFKSSDPYAHFINYRLPFTSPSLCTINPPKIKTQLLDFFSSPTALYILDFTFDGPYIYVLTSDPSLIRISAIIEKGYLSIKEKVETLDLNAEGNYHSIFTKVTPTQTTIFLIAETQIDYFIGGNDTATPPKIQNMVSLKEKYTKRDIGFYGDRALIPQGNSVEMYFYDAKIKKYVVSPYTLDHSSYGVDEGMVSFIDAVYDSLHDRIVVLEKRSQNVVFFKLQEGTVKFQKTEVLKAERVRNIYVTNHMDMYQETLIFVAKDEDLLTDEIIELVYNSTLKSWREFAVTSYNDIEYLNTQGQYGIIVEKSIISLFLLGLDNHTQVIEVFGIERMTAADIFVSPYDDTYLLYSERNVLAIAKLEISTPVLECCEKEIKKDTVFTVPVYGESILCEEKIQRGDTDPSHLCYAILNVELHSYIQERKKAMSNIYQKVILGVIVGVVVALVIVGSLFYCFKKTKSKLVKYEKLKDSVVGSQPMSRPTLQKIRSDESPQHRSERKLSF